MCHTHCPTCTYTLCVHMSISVDCASVRYIYLLVCIQIHIFVCRSYDLIMDGLFDYLLDQKGHIQIYMDLQRSHKKLWNYLKDVSQIIAVFLMKSFSAQNGMHMMETKLNGISLYNGSFTLCFHLN